MDTCYRFHQYELLPAQRRLLDAGRPVKLGGRAFDMLLVLVERRDRVVNKHELMDLVWPRLVVEENNLQVHVLALRKLLGHPAISTVPGRGYRFTLPVTVDGGTVGVDAQPPQAEPAPSPGNLPTQLPALIGRDEDLLSLQALIDQHGLVTVTGAGGIGKTRLAQGVASLHAQRPGDGVWWVELAGLNDPALVAAAVGRALQVPLQGQADATTAVLQALQGKAALLVLDNAEHLLDGVTALVGVLRERASGVKLLVTSQEVLRMLDEQVFRPGPLSLPCADDGVSAQRSGAVSLFVSRARLADPRFQLDDHNRAAVVDICRRLDGIPLAIELAAARVPLLGVEGVRQRLDHRFSVLTAGARAVMRRHQTLRAALEWSHGLLTPLEQRVLRRLGVFAGSFSLDAAQSVAEDEDIDAWEVLELLGALVDKSMVAADGHPLPRYRLLETTRLYALERLAEAGETDSVLRRHAEYCVAVAENFDVEATQHGQAADALDRLDLDRDNILHALAWCAQTDDAGASAWGLQMAGALRYYWPSRGLLGMGLAVTLRAIDRARSLPGTAHLGRALGAAALVSYWLGRRPDTEALVTRLLALGESLGLDPAIASAHFLRGYLASDGRHWAEATAHFEALRTVARRMNSLILEGNALAGLVDVLKRQGRLEEAALRADDMLALRRLAAHGHNLALGLETATAIALRRGDLVRALEWLSESLPWIRRSGSHSLARSWCSLAARAALRQGHWHRAVTVLSAIAAQCTADDLLAEEDDQRDEQTDLAAARAALGEDEYEAAWAAGRQIDLNDTVALASTGFDHRP